ncbi:hypothetical protein MBT84_43185 [Streptomyces sp. MBT84]|nr:hypothetical protein [Streptomyces sp. MBT84]
MDNTAATVGGVGTNLQFRAFRRFVHPRQPSDQLLRQPRHRRLLHRLTDARP